MNIVNFFRSMCCNRTEVLPWIVGPNNTHPTNGLFLRNIDSVCSCSYTDTNTQYYTLCYYAEIVSKNDISADEIHDADAADVDEIINHSKLNSTIYSLKNNSKTTLIWHDNGTIHSISRLQHDTLMKKMGYK